MDFCLNIKENNEVVAGSWLQQKSKATSDIYIHAYLKCAIKTVINLVYLAAQLCLSYCLFADPVRHGHSPYLVCCQPLTRSTQEQQKAECGGSGTRPRAIHYSLAQRILQAVSPAIPWPGVLQMPSSGSGSAWEPHLTAQREQGMYFAQSKHHLKAHAWKTSDVCWKPPAPHCCRGRMQGRIWQQALWFPEQKTKVRKGTGMPLVADVRWALLVFAQDSVFLKEQCLGEGRESRRGGVFFSKPLIKWGFSTPQNREKMRIRAVHWGNVIRGWRIKDPNINVCRVCHWLIRMFGQTVYCWRSSRVTECPVQPTEGLQWALVAVGLLKVVGGEQHLTLPLSSYHETCCRFLRSQTWLCGLHFQAGPIPCGSWRFEGNRACCFCFCCSRSWEVKLLWWWQSKHLKGTLTGNPAHILAWLFRALVLWLLQSYYFYLVDQHSVPATWLTPA